MQPPNTPAEHKVEDNLGELSHDQEMMVQDVRILVGPHEAYCVRCVLIGSIHQLPFDPKKNELISKLARSRNVQI